MPKSVGPIYAGLEYVPGLRSSLAQTKRITWAHLWNNPIVLILEFILESLQLSYLQIYALILFLEFQTFFIPTTYYETSFLPNYSSAKPTYFHPVSHLHKHKRLFPTYFLSTAYSCQRESHEASTADFIANPFQHLNI